MRLSEKEIKIIKKCAEEVFGEGTKVYLFGSRVYPEKKGGDIDLYIIPKFKENLLEKRAKFLAKVWRELGEQKIDLILEKNSQRDIEKIALKEGIEL
ncbi:MAG: DNA polymerase subunit beta [Thermodesulfobacterium geofontis]|uniref:DNA polymerase subunit beta n=1 Tax=Thermodesulfobacterium geofontis TaxID=1295609 RepID=A0A2N7Q8G1_9BACT|nr:MAG: DNA polymerase subunit beta [Thermodesulfobacterium geofontis]HEM56274.1 nucleotidyltransferase domain-containing protein [Thermodesulfobium narugense]